MSTIDSDSSVVEAQAIPATVTEPVVPTIWNKIDAWLEVLSDKLNPIVIKEARQAIKSRQFTVTFTLLLVFAVCWTALGVAFQMPAVMHTPSGPSIVVGYYVILAVPLLVIVPFVAFRSLAAEREDGTFELLSITSLAAIQVVLGKFASAILQMMVYFSALAPCIAFTYLLRGLDIITIGLFLCYLFLASTLLSTIGLAMATITKARHWQVMLSVVLVAALLLAGCWWLAMMAALFAEMQTRSFYDAPFFWVLHVQILLFHLSFVTLFILIASGQISFESDNRSTPIRWILLGQHALWFGCILYWMQGETQPDGMFLVGSSFALIYWWFVGSLLIGERANLSDRIRRRLPQSFLGRSLLTWLNPGSGTGYVFTLVNLAAILVAFFASATIYKWLVPPNFSFLDSEQMIRFAAGIWLYAAAYLGLGRLANLAVRNRVPSGVIFSLLLQIVMITFGTLIPLVSQLSVFGAQNFEYSALQVTNPFWTCAELAQNRAVTSGDVTIVMIILGATGIGLSLLNFFLTLREVENTRLDAPQRVNDEDDATLAARTPHRRSNPWEE